MRKAFNIAAFEALPLTLKPSDYVDFLQYFIHEKPSVRIGFNNSGVYDEMILWCEKFKISYVISREGFMYISKHHLIACLTKVVDNSKFNHTYVLGKLFGYPTCCSKRVANIGENGIDNYEKNILLENEFQEPFHLINPEGYLQGYSLISHIPCNVICEYSLKKATKAYEVIEEYQDHPAFSKWKKHWLE